MSEEEILKLWISGLSKNRVALEYQRRYNQKVKMIRLDMKHRHADSFISSRQALEQVEKTIYKYVMRRKKE